MTDEIVIRTLAEFMGTTLPEAMPDGYQSCPLWLESYDAIAPVLRKAWNEYRITAWLPGEGTSQAKDWYNHEPRDHALALATAIQEAKK